MNTRPAGPDPVHDATMVARHLAAIVESSEDAIISKTLEGIITSWNGGAQRMFGYEAHEVIGRPVTMLFPPERENEEPTIVDRIRRGERVEHYETIRKRKDGSLIHVSLSVSPIRNEEGAIIGASKIARDITAQKMLEQALRDSNQHKDHFLATLAHELRNPLAPIRNGLELQELAPMDLELQATTRQMIIRQLDQLVRLVDDLMDLSRIDQGKIHLVQQDCDLAHILTIAVEATRAWMDKFHHRLDIDVEQGLFVRGDPARLTQIFTNLLNNAAKYTPEGGRIRLEAEREDGQVFIRVQDNGIGIPGEELGHVFDMFTQVSAVERAQGMGGLGIGLNIVQRLVRMQGGEVTGESAGVGLGSTFTVRFPLQDAPGTGTTVEENGPGTAAALRVLVVDDNQDAANSLAQIMKLRGCEARAAYTGQGALELGATFGPDLVLMDIGMPHMDGYQACAAMRAAPWGKAITIVAISGWGQNEDRRRSAAAGFDEHLVKPVDHKQLMRVMERKRIH